ncbi:response regulator transcription factor [Aquibacillus rhizosphaerae]|uniref:Heme response regulator HssR n=1 Tax=Aquibacillus rhizosphaerae TaxID=3051431 RepID=A0ABT7L5I0_9BACI|nr:response regulator transcription factor [Aquibacillus sp. LR5S19]MDL4840455.1 response regulator transcription factor [Aquibacillus sp. LR5S19]
MNKPTILIVDDEPQMRMLLNIHLHESFHLLEATGGPEAIDIVKKEKVDVVLLDIMMPTLNGKEVCKKIRLFNKKIPIILLTALNESKDKVEGLTIGADDYVVKPFDPEELEARIYVQLRKQPGVANNHSFITINDITINSNSREVFVLGNLLKLTPKEFDLLYLLASNLNWVFTREQLLDKVWGVNDVVDIRTVDSHVRYLRDKFKKAGIHTQLIKTIWGVGYKFSSGDSE